MTQFVLIPLKTTADLQIFRNSVEVQVSIESLKSILYNKLYDHIFTVHPNQRLCLWGFPRGNKSSEANKWNRITDNDVAVFISNGSFAGYSRIGSKFQSESVAQSIWPELIEEDSRQYIITFDKVVGVADDVKSRFDKAILKSNFDLEVFEVYDNTFAIELLELLGIATLPLRSSSGHQTFGLNAAERRVVEKYGVEMAIRYLSENSFSDIEDVGDYESFDIKANKAGVSFIFEVKGTTGDGSSVILTRNEVSVQGQAFPNNGLILVKNIELKRGEVLSTYGGELIFNSPWEIEPDKLKPISYDYIL